VLLGFPVRMVFPAIRTKLLHLDTASGGFLILRAGVVPVFALAALERDDFSWHFYALPYSVQNTD
jgi:hypothetical protein